ncbi:hypothetical protein BB560_001723 [Smittium megazygosporum]|uniref:Tubulin-tyrosine ligase n=1 Tax=Smittium megazygosporum TaxID=133381 RepID=A0A2T9ZGS5_9FUNG|nr:hypothetical protein BB560_001723 [Smittium megazygosporum]
MSAPKCNIFVGIEDPYTRKLLLQSLERYKVISSVVEIEPNTPVSKDQYSSSQQSIFWLEYEQIPFEEIQIESRKTQKNSEPGQFSVVSCAYCIRKGLIRKAQMSMGLNVYIAKHPESILSTAIPETYILDLDDPEYLDEALNECFEVQEAMEQNMQIINSGLDSSQTKKFLLKPSLTGKGTGIHIFQFRNELEDILSNEFKLDDSDDSDEELEINQEQNNVEMNSSYDWQSGYGSAISQIREWVIQRYVDRPLLLSLFRNRKFHIRVYCLAVGGISVYVFREMLALFASKPYDSSYKNTKDSFSYITNTYVQTKHSDFDEETLVKLFWELDGSSSHSNTKIPQNKLPEKNSDRFVTSTELEFIYQQIKDITRDLFDAATSNFTTFQPWNNCFEMFGLDFIVNEDLQVFFLEANAYPDFKQTGSKLSMLVSRFFDSVVEKVIDSFVISANNSKDGLSNDSNPALDFVFSKTMFG